MNDFMFCSAGTLSSLLSEYYIIINLFISFQISAHRTQLCVVQDQHFCSVEVHVDQKELSLFKSQASLACLVCIDMP